MTPKAIEQVEYGKTFTIPGWRHIWVKEGPAITIKDEPGYTLVAVDLEPFVTGKGDQRYRMYVSMGTLVIETTKLGE